MAFSSFILWEIMNQAKEVFVSYCIRDKNWVDTLLEFIDTLLGFLMIVNFERLFSL